MRPSRPSTIPPTYNNPYARLVRPPARREPLMPPPRLVTETEAFHRLRVWLLSVEEAS